MIKVQKDIAMISAEDVHVFPDLPVSRMPFALASFGTSFPNKNYHIERQKSKVTVLEFIVSGTGVVKTTHGSFSPVAGDSYLLMADEAVIYYADADDPWEKIWINLQGTMVKPLLESYGLSSSTLLPGLDLSPFILQIHRIASDKTLTTEQIMDQSFVVFVELCQFIRSNTPKDSCLSHIPANIAQLKEYLDNHICEDLSLERCSRITYLSVSQTIRSFRNAFGVTPYEYLNQRRISTAKLLLANSSMSIDQIAVRTGFRDRNYFSKYFKKKTGKSPNQYRKQQ